MKTQAGVSRPSVSLVREAALLSGVCIRPFVRRCTDTETAETMLVPIPCGSTLASKCAPCAERARKLRMQQCREGWHLDTEPDREPDGAVPAETEPPGEEEAGTDPDPDEDQDETVRRVRSTRRRDDVPDLPRLPVASTTLGRTFHDDKTGKTFRPSMFVTLTLPSYGRVRSDGTPVNAASYDYRRAALDALHLSKLWDRFVQNLRRACGYEVQYFTALEPQRRLAPHLHAAIRGAIPRALLKQVIAATYASVWWPPCSEVVYSGDSLPTWDFDQRAYLDPRSGKPLPTWEQALDALDANELARPVHTLRFGKQSDIQGLLGGTAQADRRVGYLTKYLTKALSEPLDTDDQEDGNEGQEQTEHARKTRARRKAHIDRLHREVKWLPCSPRCANWLRYGVQPKGAEDGMQPGACSAKAHDREHLGCGGRRVLVSRKWTGKTLTAHRADRASAVRQVLEAAGIVMEDHTTYSATGPEDEESQRFEWSNLDPQEISLDYARVIATAVERRKRWRDQYDQAREHLGPDHPLFGNSANPLAA